MKFSKFIDGVKVAVVMVVKMHCSPFRAKQRAVRWNVYTWPVADRTVGIHDGSKRFQVPLVVHRMMIKKNVRGSSEDRL